MKRRLILAMAPLVLVIARAGPAPAQTWTDYRTDDGRYHIQLPGPLTVRTVPLPLGNNESAPMTEVIAAGAGGTSYQLAYVNYPSRISQAASTDVLLDRVRNNMGAGNVVRGEKKLTLGRFPGREYLVVEPNGRNTAVRIYWVRGRLYQLMAAGGPGIEARPETAKFLDSFEAVTP